MPTLVRVIARAAFAHDGIAVPAGAWVMLPAAEAAILARQGLVNLSTAVLSARGMTPEPAPACEAAPVRRRRYRRADLTAEPPA